MDKRDILVIGCSWSRAFVGPNDKMFLSWPEILARDTGVSVWNFSHYCNSIPHQYYQLQHLLQHHGDRFTDVVVQYTTENRATMVQNIIKYNDLLTPDALEQTRYETETYREVPDDKLLGNHGWNGLGLNHINPSGVTKRWKSMFYDLINYNIGSVGPCAHYITAVLQHEMKRLIDSYGKRCVTYKHFYYLLPQTEVYLTRDRSYMDFILQYDMPNFYDFTIDDGYHFGLEGSQCIVDDLIRPRLEL